MRIRILAPAEEDLLAGFRFYEAQYEGLGSYFQDSLFADIDGLMIHAGVHRVVFGKYYRMPASRFPFAVYYTIDGQTVLVHAVLDCRQNPIRMKKRLR
jgi:hypothetical protein